MQTLGLILSSLLMFYGEWIMAGLAGYPPIYGGILLLIGFGLIITIIMFTMKDKKPRHHK